jgi:hypothetical protein
VLLAVTLWLHLVEPLDQMVAAAVELVAMVLVVMVQVQPV